MIIRKFRYLLFLFVFVISGCALLEHSEEIATLRALNESQKDIDGHVKGKKKLFYKLSEDVKNNRLKAGLSKKNIVDTYGQPVLSIKGPSGEEKLLYRHPLDYFSDYKIYLYFDSGHKLIRWEY